MSTFLEGVEAIRLPCTLALLIPAIITAAAAGHRRVLALAGFAMAATAVIWARFVGTWIDDPTSLLGFLVGLGLAAVLVLLARPATSELAVPGLGAAAGLVAGWLWRPCVGPQLGEIINRAPEDRIGTIAPTAAYVVGVLVLAVAFVIAPNAWPRVRRWFDHPTLRSVAAGLGVLLGLTIAVGWYGDLVAELVRRSTI